MLVLNSIRLKSFEVGLAGDLPNTVKITAARKLKNEFIFVRTRIIRIRGFPGRDNYFLTNVKLSLHS